MHSMRVSKLRLIGSEGHGPHTARLRQRSMRFRIRRARARRPANREGRRVCKLARRAGETSAGGCLQFAFKA